MVNVVVWVGGLVDSSKCCDIPMMQFVSLVVIYQDKTELVPVSQNMRI